MWCLWKSRNDNVFARKPGAPSQIYQMTKAMHDNLEMSNFSSQISLKEQTKSIYQRSRSFDEGNEGTIQNQASAKLPRQGETLETDLHITDTKFFSDVTWKTKKAPGIANTVSGIGIYCNIRENNHNATALIQASMPRLPSVLQAESQALLVAAEIAVKLHTQKPTFMTDNSILAKAATAQTITDQQIPWEIRKQIAMFKMLVTDNNAQIYHVKRNLNGVAHNCAHQAIRQNQSMPIYNCINSTHRNSNCPIIDAVKQINSENLVIHAVNCL
jgi:hypothetical protein